MAKKLRPPRRRGLDPKAELTIHPERLSLGLGITQLVFGILSIIFGIALIPAFAWGAQAAVGIWSGVIFVVDGSLAVLANKRRILKNIVYCSAGCLCSIILGFIVFIFHAVAVHYNRFPYEYSRIAWELSPHVAYLQWANLKNSCVLGMNIILMFGGLIHFGCGFQQFYLCSMTISQYEKFLESAEANRGQVNQAAQVESPATTHAGHHCPAKSTAGRTRPGVHMSSQV